MGNRSVTNSAIATAAIARTISISGVIEQLIDPARFRPR
jgi:hypothetical protein